MVTQELGAEDGESLTIWCPQLLRHGFRSITKFRVSLVHVLLTTVVAAQVSSCISSSRARSLRTRIVGQWEYEFPKRVPIGSEHILIRFFDDQTMACYCLGGRSRAAIKGRYTIDANYRILIDFDSVKYGDRLERKIHANDYGLEDVMTYGAISSDGSRLILAVNEIHSVLKSGSYRSQVWTDRPFD